MLGKSDEDAVRCRLEFLLHVDVSRVVIHQVFPLAGNNATSKSNLFSPMDLMFKSSEDMHLDSNVFRQLNVGISGI